MGARKNHPREAMHRPVHIDADAAIPAALLRLRAGVRGRKLVVSLGDEAA